MNKPTKVQQITYPQAETLAAAFRAAGFSVAIHTASPVVEAYEINGEECDGVFGTGHKLSIVGVNLSACGKHEIHRIEIEGEGFVIGRSRLYTLTATPRA